MVPAPWTQPDAGPAAPPLVVPALRRRVRVAVAAVAVGLVGVFVVAARLDPYDADGAPRTMATHTQLGLPECNFLRLTGVPCPSCGMTTSFALLIRGDVIAAGRANPVGALLAATLL